ncbi:hypothetical protein CKM354_000668400 [Cercospora kikuchii]|uniref:Uncharacterized protein n=1 Tax=Cercospora kikuchii TaxID=84275 RepID=A0A9P3FGS0_9PEZI|nr:uncharacterized protein CKM354_000668400 [Cercospora kikuchii]GIZ43457.1 hypothetical protein CKM354_000668400 [Cercospora kikuchii]
MDKKPGDSNRQRKDPPPHTGSVGLLLANSTTKPTKQSGSSKGTKQKGGKDVESTSADQTPEEKKKEICEKLESYCRVYWTNINKREWNLDEWVHMAPIFTADPAVGTLPQLQTLADFVESRRLLALEHPTYSVREVELSTELDEPNGRAECFLGLEVSGAPEGVVRQNMGILEFMREDKLAVKMGMPAPPGEEVPAEEWHCVAYRSFRGLGGIMAADS